MAAASVSERITRWLISWRWVLMALDPRLAGWPCRTCPRSRLGFLDRSIENMFAPGDPLLVPYKQLKRTFGGNEIALAAYVDPDLLTPGGMSRLESVTNDLAAVPGVQAAMSLTSTPLGTDLINDALREPFLELFEGYMVGADRKTAAVVCMLAPEDENSNRTETVDRLRARIAQESGVFDRRTGDGQRGVSLARTRWHPVGTRLDRAVDADDYFLFSQPAPLGDRAGGDRLGDTLAHQSGAGRRSFSPEHGQRHAVVDHQRHRHCACDAHHRQVSRGARQRLAAAREPLLACGSSLAVPIIWVCLTDTAGFASLLAAKVGPVQDFGAMMAIGSTLVLVSVACLLPGLTLWGRRGSDPQRAWGEGNLDHGLHQVAAGLERWPKTVGLVTVAFIAVSLVGYRWLDVETDFTKNFRASSPVVKSYQFVETNLGGAGVWDVFVPAPETLDNAFLDRVRRLEKRLRSEVRVQDENDELRPGLTKVLSVVDAMEMFTGSFPQALRDAMPAEQLLADFRAQMPVMMGALLGKDPDEGQKPYHLRIMLRARERQPSAQKNLLIAQVREISQKEFPDARVTGFFVLLTNLIDSMIRDQWVSFIIATSSIWLMMVVAFRSVSLAVIAMIPNALPIMVVSGLMGWFDLRINMGAAMIAAVSMGLAVDASIHYIVEFLEARQAGLSVTAAIDAVHQTAGRAMVFSTLALMIGFSALCLSQFVPLIYFGVLMGLSMFGGMLGNLIILPLLLRIWSRSSTRALAPPEPVASAGG